MKSTQTLLVILLLLAVGAEGSAREKKEFDPRLRRNYEIVFDTSGSMSGKKLKIAKESLKRFLARLPAETYVGLIVFERGRPKEVLPIDRHAPATLARTVDRMKAGGHTPIKDSIELAMKNLAKRKAEQFGYGDFIILIVTDGEETIDPRGLPGTVRRAIDSGYVIDVIGFDLPREHSLKALVTNYRHAGNQAELDRALSDVLAEAESFEEISDFAAEQ